MPFQNQTLADNLSFDIVLASRLWYYYCSGFVSELMIVIILSMTVIAMITFSTEHYCAIMIMLVITVITILSSMILTSIMIDAFLLLLSFLLLRLLLCHS